VQPSSSYSILLLEKVAPTDLIPDFNEGESSSDANRIIPLQTTSPLLIPSSQMIDNSKLTYIPMHVSCGVTVFCRPDVLTKCRRILDDLDMDLRQCLRILPRSTHGLIRRTNIWVNNTYYYGPSTKPKNVNHSTAHHDKGWLLWARDKIEKAPGIEIYNCFDYRKMRWHWNGSGLLLHELCHIIHQFCLGLDNESVQEAYQQAKDCGLYDSVMRRDWAGLEVDQDMSYALINQKEFFAELSVAYWSDGYDKVVGKNPTSMVESSPPFTCQSVITRLDKDEYPIADQSSFSKPSFVCWTRNLGIPPHCNKFYPFTREQFNYLDPTIFRVFEHLWEEIEEWEDLERKCCRSVFCTGLR